jgi:hypothetical protein
LPNASEIRETQFENLVDRYLGEAGGTDRVAGGEHIDQVAIKLSQSLDPDPVRIAGDWF